MAKAIVQLVLSGVASMKKDETRKAGFVILEGVCPPGVTAEDVDKQLQRGNVRAVIKASTSDPESSKGK